MLGAIATPAWSCGIVAVLCTACCPPLEPHQLEAPARAEGASRTAPERPGRGLYVDAFDTILGDPRREADLLAFAHAHGFRELILYDLHVLEPEQGESLRRFAAHARARGIARVGAAVGGTFSLERMVAVLDAAGDRALLGAWVTEHEYWWPPGDTAEATRQARFARFVDLLDAMAALAPAPVRLEAYFGFPSAEEVAALAGRLDRVYLHYYRPRPQGSYGFVYDDPRLGSLRDRLVAFGAIHGRTGALEIRPLFHGGAGKEGEGMGPWLAEHGLAAAEATWRAELARDPAGAALRPRVGPAQWFSYSRLRAHLEPAN